MPKGGDDKKRYERNRQHQQQAKIKAAKKAGAGSVAGSKTAGRIKGGDLFNRSKSSPANLANQKQKGVAGAKTAGRIKGEDLFKRPQPVQQHQPAQQPEVEELAEQEANKMTPEDAANRTARAAASGVETGAAAVETGAKVAEGTAAGAQAAAKGTEAAAKGAQAAAKGVGAASEAASAASKGLTSAGQALSSTGLGAIVGVPLMALGGTGSAAAAGGKMGAKGGETEDKGVEKGAKAAGEAAKKAKEGAKKVKEGAKNVKEKAKDTKGALDQKHEQNKEDKLDKARAKIGDKGLSQNEKTGDKKPGDSSGIGNQISTKQKRGLDESGDKERALIDKMGLSDARQHVKDKGLSKADFEFGRKNAGIEDPKLPNELLRDPKSGSKDLFDQAELNLKRKAALHASRLSEKIGAQNKAKALAATSSQLSPDAKGSKAGLEGMDPTDRLQQNRRTQFLERGIMARNAKQQAEANKTSATAKETEETRDEVKKEAKAAFRRGMVYLVDLIAAALDMSTSGLSFIIDIFMYLFTLGWLNLEMIYGRWLAKGQSKYISPISWAPIKLPVDENAFMLQCAIVTADLALATAIAVITFGGVCFAYDYMILLATPIDFAAAIAAGGEGLCLGGIIHSIVTGL